MSQKKEGAFVGKSQPRSEDRILLRGAGTYVDDLNLPGMVHAAFAHSSVPHAKIRSVDLADCRSAEGVVLALTGKEVEDALGKVGGQQITAPKAWRERVTHRIDVPAQPLLATEKVLYVGEPFAVLCAESRYLAEDALERVDVDFDVLPAVTDPEAGMASDAPTLHPSIGTNIAAELSMGKGDVDSALARAPHRLKRRYYHHRYAGMPMECRAVVADYDERSDRITIWSTTQVVHWVRRQVAAMLKMPEDRVRCIAPEVGGGFGTKGHVYPEDILIPYLAKRLKRPVKWTEDRNEHFLNSVHARDNIHNVEVGFDDTGRILALKDDFIIDSGAFAPVGTTCGANSAAHMLGPYDIPHYRASAQMVTTNKTPNAPYRGAGRPEAVFAMERTVDLIAAELGLDPIAVRYSNMVKPEQMPYSVGLTYRDGVPVTYDSGDFPAALRAALEELGGLENFRERQRQARAEGRYIGLGVGCYTEGTAVGPFESAMVRVDPSGAIAVATGACDQGQGHRTAFAQVAADAWQLPLDKISITVSDTAGIAMGYGTVASRSGVTSSTAIMIASDRLKEKVLRIAANMLETTESDLEFRDGGVGVKGVPAMHVTLAEVEKAARPDWDHKRPPGMEPGLEVTYLYEPPTVTWAYATDAAIVEVDPMTGRIAVEKLIAVHDSGTLINPLIAEGQVCGGLAQGFGAALLEELVYDSAGQLLTGSFADYLMPTAPDLPPITVLHPETPTPLNPLGVKGLGEGGAIAPPAVIANAVCDALRPFGVEFNRLPLKWEDVAAVFGDDPFAPNGPN